MGKDIYWQIRPQAESRSSGSASKTCVREGFPTRQPATSHLTYSRTSAAIFDAALMCDGKEIRMGDSLTERKHAGKGRYLVSMWLEICQSTFCCPAAPSYQFIAGRNMRPEPQEQLPRRATSEVPQRCHEAASKRKKAAVTYQVAAFGRILRARPYPSSEARR